MKQLKIKIIASIIMVSLITPVALAGGMTANQVRILQQQNKKTNIQTQQQKLNAQERVKFERKKQELYNKETNIEKKQQNFNDEKINIERNLRSIQKQQTRQLEKSYNTFNK